MNGQFQKKKILFIITQSEFGGAQHYVWEISRSLNPAVYDVVVAAGPEGDNELGLLGQLQKIGVQTRHLKYLKRAINPLFDFLALRELKKLIKNEKPDVLFLNSTKTGILGSFAVKQKNTDIKRNDSETKFREIPSACPVVMPKAYTIGDIRVNPSIKIIYRIGGWAFNEDIANWKKKLYLFLEKYTAKWKDLVIVNSEADRKIGIESGVASPGKIITIYNGLDWQNVKFLARDEARFSLRTIVPSNMAKNQNADWWVSRNIVGTIANLYETKGLRYFIEAAAIARKTFPETLFFIIGEGRQRAELKNLILKNRLRDNFFIFGAVPSARLYLKAFDIFVLPSVKEGMPWAILEAMAAETPIVATSVGGVPEMLDPSANSANSLQVNLPQVKLKGGILVPPKESRLLADAIVYILKNPASGEALASQAKQILADKFSFREMLQKTETALNM